MPDAHDMTADELEALAASKRAEPKGPRRHAHIDHRTPHRRVVRFQKKGEHAIVGQVLPINQVAKDGVLASARADADGNHTWTVPEGAVVYVHDDAVANLVDAGHAEEVESAEEHEAPVRTAVAVSVPTPVTSTAA